MIKRANASDDVREPKVFTLTRGESGYPVAVIDALKGKAPAVLYCLGNHELLDRVSNLFLLRLQLPITPVFSFFGCDESHQTHIRIKRTAMTLPVAPVSSTGQALAV